jgi:hypothetical protein
VQVTWHWPHTFATSLQCANVYVQQPMQTNAGPGTATRVLGVQAAEKDQAQARLALQQSDHDRTEACLSNIDALLRRLRISSAATSNSATSHSPDKLCSCSSAARQASDGSVSSDCLPPAHNKGASTVPEADALHLDSAEVEVRVLAHANRELLVCCLHGLQAGAGALRATWSEHLARRPRMPRCLGPP